MVSRFFRVSLFSLCHSQAERAIYKYSMVAIKSLEGQYDKCFEYEKSHFKSTTATAAATTTATTMAI